MLILIRRIRLQIALALLIVAIAALACGVDPGGAPGSDSVVLTERQALKKAYDRSHNKPYANLQGTPISAWGERMTYAEAAELMGNSISSDTSEYDRRNDQVWYIVLEGELSMTTPSVPGGSGSTNEVGRGFMAIQFNVNGSFGGSSSSLIKTDFGQDGLPVIEIPNDLESIVVPTAPPAPAVTAAPPATPAPPPPRKLLFGPLLPAQRTATAEAEALLPRTPTPTPLPSPIDDTTNFLFDGSVFHALIGRVAEFLGESDIPIIGRDSSIMNEWWRIETEQYLMGRSPQPEFTIQVPRFQVMESGSIVPDRPPIFVPAGGRVLLFLMANTLGDTPPLSSHVYFIARAGHLSDPSAGVFPINDGRLTIRQDGVPKEVDLSAFLERFNEVAAMAERHTGPYPPQVPSAPTPTPAPTPVGGRFSVETLATAIEQLPDELKLVISEDVVIVFNDDNRERNLFFNFNGPATAFHLPTASYSDLRLEKPPSLRFRGTRRYITPEASEAINQAIYGDDTVNRAVRDFVASR